MLRTAVADGSCGVRPTGGGGAGGGRGEGEEEGGEAIGGGEGGGEGGIGGSGGGEVGWRRLGRSYLTFFVSSRSDRWLF